MQSGLTSAIPEDLREGVLRQMVSTVGRRQAGEPVTDLRRHRLGCWEGGGMPDSSRQGEELVRTGGSGGNWARAKTVVRSRG